MLLNVGLTGEVSNTDVINSLREHLQSTPSGLNVYVSGQAGILADLQQAVLDSLDLTTIITVILVIILLLIIYRSPVAALVPLLTIGAAYLVSRGALGFIAQAGFPCGPNWMPS
jgi:RND superfamily putative drug exporter